jgi:hypothetical protein
VVPEGTTFLFTPARKLDLLIQTTIIATEAIAQAIATHSYIEAGDMLAA